jgi:hypothetical protein
VRPFPFPAILAFILAAVPSAYPDNKKQGQGKTVATTEDDYKALSNAQIVGKIVSVTPSDKTLTLEFEYSLLVPKNKKSVNKASPAVAQLYQAQQQLLQNQQKATAAQAAKHLQQLRLHSGRVGHISSGGAPAHFTIKTEKKEFDLQSVEDVHVRIAKLPPQVDGKGKPKAYTDQELKERKGSDTALPGYTSSFEDLRAGQVVKIKLGRSKPAKAKDEQSDDDHPKMTLIVISDSGDSPADGAKSRK